MVARLAPLIHVSPTPSAVWIAFWVILTQDEREDYERRGGKEWCDYNQDNGGERTVEGS